MNFIHSTARFFHQHPQLRVAVVLGFSILTGCLITLGLGQDIGIDARNYHIYNAWAYLNNRMEIDLYAAGFHTYLPPLAEFPLYYLMIEWFPDSPKFVSFLSGIPAGIFIFFSGMLISQTIRTIFHFSTPTTYLFSILLLFFGILDPRIIGQFGSMSNEIVLSCATIAALWIIIKFPRNPLVSAILSGSLLGMATALKFTASSFIIPIFLSLLLLHNGIQKRMQIFLIFPLAFVFSFALGYGYWGAQLYHSFQNPFFPICDNFFPDSWLGDNMLSRTKTFTDKRPGTLFEFLQFSFDRSKNGAILVLTNVCILTLTTVRILSRYQQKYKNLFLRDYFKASSGRIIDLVCLFFITSFIIWGSVFAILRYFIPCVILFGIIIFISFSLFFNSLKRKQIFYFFITSLLLSSIVFKTHVLLSKRHEWDLRYNGNSPELHLPVLPEKSLILLGEQTSFLAPFLTKTNPTLIFVGGMVAFESDQPLHECKMKQKIQEKIDLFSGPIFLLIRNETGTSPFPHINPQHLFPQYGLSLNAVDPDIRLENRYGTFSVFKCQKITK